MKITRATEQDSKEITALRIAAYRNAPGTELTQTDHMAWSFQDSQHLVLGVKNEQGNYISTLRGSIVNTKEEIEQSADIRIYENLPVPTFMIDKGTTLPAYRKQGLLPALRLQLIQAAKEIGAVSIVFTINEGASRIVLLEKMGFQLTEANIGHRTLSAFKNEGKVYFGLLHQGSI